MGDLGWPPLPPDLLPADRDAALLSADLVDGVANIYGSGDYADVKFVVEGEPVPAHRLVLCLRSPYFRRLFAARMTAKAHELQPNALFNVGNSRRGMKPGQRVDDAALRAAAGGVEEGRWLYRDLETKVFDD